MATSPDEVINTCAVFCMKLPPSSLTRASADSGLRAWGLKLRERVGFKRAAVAVARKLAVTMHAMLKSGALFDRNAAAAAS